jgi:Sel1 repeat-containing protein
LGPVWCRHSFWATRRSSRSSWRRGIVEGLAVSTDLAGAESAAALAAKRQELVARESIAFPRSWTASPGSPINLMGLALYGRMRQEPLEEGPARQAKAAGYQTYSCQAIKWFTVLGLPVVPLGTFRVVRPVTRTWSAYRAHSFVRPDAWDWGQAVRHFAVTVGVVVAAVYSWPLLVQALPAGDGSLAGRERGCARGNADACYEAAGAYEEGDGVARDVGRAIQYYERSCGLGGTWACNNLGALYIDGKGVAVDQARGAAYLKTGCDGGLLTACANLGRSYQKGKGVAADPFRAVALYKQACDGGEGLGCFWLGRMYEDGDTVLKDAQEAARLFGQGCQERDTNACERLKTLRRASQGGR